MKKIVILLTLVVMLMSSVVTSTFASHLTPTGYKAREIAKIGSTTPAEYSAYYNNYFFYRSDTSVRWHVRSVEASVGGSYFNYYGAWGSQHKVNSSLGSANRAFGPYTASTTVIHKWIEADSTGIWAEKNATRLDGNLNFYKWNTQCNCYQVVSTEYHKDYI